MEPACPVLMPLTVLILDFIHKLKRPDPKGGKLLKKKWSGSSADFLYGDSEH